MTRSCALALGTALLCTFGSRVVAQVHKGTVVIVMDTLSNTPVLGAVVRSSRLRATQLTDRLGVARFGSVTPLDTLVISAIGYQADTLIIHSADALLTVHLRRQPVTLGELTASSEGSLAPTASGRWTLPADLLRRVPPAVEADPLRSLGIVPAVSYSSPLSARPIIRGYDAAESVIRIDGFEIINPYHVGRFFSGFPADAAAAVKVSPAPLAAQDGATLVGVVDVEGRSSGEGGGSRAGLDASVVSTTGWYGTTGATPLFLAARVAYLSLVTRLADGSNAPYAFQDAYVRTRLGLGGRRSVDVSAYGSHDRLGDLGLGSGARWSNMLLGQRWRLLDRSTSSMDVTASYNHFSIQATDVPARNSLIDVTNRFTRAGIDFEVERHFGGLILEAGAGASDRRITNVLTVREGDDFAPTDRTTRLTDYDGFLSGVWTSGRVAVSGAVRLDGSRSARIWQPRVHVVWQATPVASLSLTAARAGRLYQLLTDAEPEPSVAIYDFWLNAGETGVPVPRVDHLSVDGDVMLSPWALHLAAFRTRGMGLGELRPVTDQRSGVSTFRYGDSRSEGLEVRIGWHEQSARPSWTVGYVLSRSERRWGDGQWVPWRLDRRHLIRTQVEVPLGRWTAFGLGEWTSGQPITPVAEVFRRPVAPGGNPAVVSYRYAAEGSGRSAAVYHVDVGARARFTGPWRTRMFVGLSVINLGFTPVAPEVPIPAEQLRPPYSPEGVPYRRSFTLPAIPSVTVRVEF